MTLDSGPARRCKPTSTADLGRERLAEGSHWFGESERSPGEPLTGSGMASGTTATEPARGQ
eukprot:6140620-Alexandrium_andersonii.AAC.1